MQKFKLLSRNVLHWSLSVLALGMAISFSSCKKTETNKPAPTVTVNPISASNTAGSKVSTNVQVDSPEGGTTLNILVNGVANTTLPDVALDGTSSQAVAVEFTIPPTATVGANYVITFQAIDTKNQFSSVGVFVVTVSAVPAKTIVDIPSGNITTNTTWTADKIYRINGFVRIGKDEKPTAGTVAPMISSPTTLTIAAGTVIYGKVGTPGGTLIIQRGSQLIANGTATQPIVFTSEKSPGSRKSGDWGGVVLCGQAKNNILNSASTGTAGIEELEGGYGGFHGGTNDTDNSGSLKYVRIEFAGYPVNPNQEINGLTLGSVGSGTTLQYIQVAYANDDSFEWFGGAANASNLIAYKGIDDDFDTDNGFSGKVQFGLAIRDSNIADQSGSNGFECDNDATGSSNTPVTTAQFSNMTIIGGKATSGTTIDIQFQNGVQIRRNAQQDIFNSFITGYPNGIYIDNALGSPGTVSNATNNLLQLKNNILAGVESWGGNGFGSVATADEITALGAAFGSNTNHPNNPRGRVVAGGVGAFTNGAFAYTTGELQINAQAPVLWFKSNNTILSKWTNAGINANIFEPLNGTPSLLPTAGSALTAGADFTGLAGFTTVTYRGAFGTTDWTTGWVNWNPQQTDYSK